MSYKIFLSYSSKDNPLITQIKSAIHMDGVEIMYDENSVGFGDDIPSRVHQTIEASDLFLLFWSSNAQNSEWVSQEIGIAQGLGIPVLPVILDQTEQLPGFIKSLKFIRIVENIHEAVSNLKEIISSNYLEQNKKQSKDLFIGISVIALILYLIFGGGQSEEEEDVDFE